MPDDAPRGSLPSGTVTFLFTDIEGSTSRWESATRAMAEALPRHDAIVRRAVARHDGSVFKTVGDEFCVAFSRAADAACAAEAIQRDLAAEDFEAAGGIRVRIAVHSGVADERDGDYFGPAINRVSRLLSVGHGGQTLLSASAAELMRPLPAGWRLEDLGQHELKGLSTPEHICGLIFPGLPDTFPPLRTAARRQNNLPYQVTTIFGREREISDIGALLKSQRLVTLCGPGGAGKTCCAVQTAVESVGNYPDGVWFIDLAPVSEPRFVASAFSAALSLPQPGDGDVLKRVLGHLQNDATLLVVDNCEHVIDEAARIISELLQHCTSVRIVATSREVLRVPGEHVFPVPMLGVPPPSVSKADDALGYAAVQLFVARAQSARRDFAVTDQNVSAIANVCRRVDGNPLAIELAAARVATLSPEAIASNLKDRFRILTGGSRTTPGRQQTLLALIDWSYDLLSQGERDVFARLSVFAGSWTIEAAEAVCAGSSVEADEVFETLVQLVQKSLVVADGDDSGRFSFLETIREYARLKLRSSPSTMRSAHDLHAQWAATFAEKYTSGQSLQLRWEAVKPEYDNIREALVWSLGDGNDATFAARIAASLGDLWYEAGLRVDGRRFLEAALSRFDAASNPGIAGLLHLHHSMIAFGDEAVASAKASLAAFEAAGDPLRANGARIHLCYTLWQTGDVENSKGAINRAIEWYESNNMTNEQDYAEALSMRAVLGFSGSDERARDDFERAIRLYTATGFELGGARARSNLAELEFARGDTLRALLLAEQAAAVFTRMGVPTRVANVRINLAAYQLALERIDDAAESASEALSLAQKAGDDFLCVAAICHLTAVLAIRSEYRAAKALLDYVDAWFTRTKIEPEWSLQRSMDRARAMIPNVVSEREMEIVRPLAGDDAIELAMGAASRPSLGMVSR